jgi:hypothetical protein
VPDAFIAAAVLLVPNMGALIWFLSRMKADIKSARDEASATRKIALKATKHLNRVRRHLAGNPGKVVI